MRRRPVPMCSMNSLEREALYAHQIDAQQIDSPPSDGAPRH
jgi:hypothetical protein